MASAQPPRPQPPRPHAPAPTTAAGIAGLAALRADPAGAALFFDYDGVLAPIVSDPDRAVPHPDAVGLLRRLAARVGGLGIITGRPVDVVRRLSGLDTVGGSAGLADLRIAGHYGLERWDAATGEVTAPPPHPGVDRVRAELPDLLERLDAPEGTTVEDKGRSLAVHVRRTPDPARATAVLLPSLRELAAATGLALEPGRMVAELRPPDIDKGAALRELAAELGAHAVLYAGDDLGDLPAYDAVEDLRAGGTPGLLLCSGSTEVRALTDRADVVVDGPAGVLAFLRELADDWDTRG